MSLKYPQIPGDSVALNSLLSLLILGTTHLVLNDDMTGTQSVQS